MLYNYYHVFSLLEKHSYTKNGILFNFGIGLNRHTTLFFHACDELAKLHGL